MQSPIAVDKLHKAESEIAWRLLSIVNLVRLILASTLLVIFEFSGFNSPWGGVHPEYFRLGVVALLSVSIVMSYAILKQRPGQKLLAFAGSLLDSIIFAVLMHSSGGYGSGLGVMLLLSLSTAALILTRQLSLITSAAAVIALLGQHILSDFESPEMITDYTGAGLLGLLFFITSIGAQRFGERYRETEALARRRGVDIANLSQLNDYVVQRMRESIVVLDEHGNTRLMNQSAARLLGAHNPKSKYKLSELSPKLYGYWKDSLRSVHQRDDHIITLDGFTNMLPSFVPLGSQASDGTLLFLEDLSIIQEKVQQSKLAALGRLSASIAHEIRNPLGAISHANQLLSESENLNSDDHYFTNLITKQVKRMNQIIENVQGLTRAPLDKPEELDLHEWLESFVEEFIQTMELETGQIAFEFYNSPKFSPVEPRHHVSFGESQLRQVIGNIFHNALIHAVEDTADLKIICRTRKHEISDRFMLEILDNGKGIDAEEAEQLFEPFHSSVSTGSGLGLYIAREMCSLNYAQLSVINHKKHDGACFRILFADTERWTHKE